MLQEMHYIEQELLPMLRERAPRFRENAQKQLRQWKGEPGVCSLLLSVSDVPEADRLPNYDLYEIHTDIEKMFVSQLKGALHTAMANGDAVPSVRADVGCGAICTLIGGLKQNYYPDKMPWLQQHLSIEEAAEMTVDDLVESEEFTRGLEEMRFMKEMLQGTGIEVFPMDLQGPIDVTHLWLGNEFFYDLYDEPELMHKVLALSVEADSYAMKKNLEIIQPTDHVAHYNGLVLPAEAPLKVSEDTTTLISQEHIEEFMKPYTEELLRRFGGGYIHYCGNNQHLLNMIPEVERCIGLNFGNPERHDPAQVLSMLAEKNMLFYGSFPRKWEELYPAARQEDGRYNLIMTASCKASEQEALLERFDQLTQV